MYTVGEDKIETAPQDSPVEQNASAEIAQRLKTVKVGVRADLKVSRQIFNRVPAYVIRDPITFQTFKFSVEDYQVFVRINSQEELGKIFEKLCSDGLLDQQQEEGYYKFVVYLNQLGVLALPVSDGATLYERFKKKRIKDRNARFTNLLFMRVPLINPDAFLDKTIHIFKPLFSKAAFVLWLLCLVICTTIVTLRWEEFLSPLSTILTLKNLPVLWTLLVCLKVFHEFGHAYACKHFGGKVPEMGAMFVVGTPCAYVDASDSWGFPKPIHRIIVALGGMYFESICAMFAVVVWALSGPGIVHSTAQYAIMLATVVTVGFNANPLMKYDGYYILSDLVGMPNLRDDAQRQLNRQLNSWLFGIKPDFVSGSWLSRLSMSMFGLLSAIYKFVVVIGISIMVAFKIPAIGIGCAVAYIINMILQSSLKLFRFITGEQTKGVRVRAAAVTAVVIGGFLIGTTTIPLPANSNASGVVKRERDKVLRAKASGFLIHSFVKDGAHVSENAAICQLENYDLRTKLKQKRVEIEQLQMREAMNASIDVQKVSSIRRKLATANSELEQCQADVANLVIKAPVDGTVARIEQSQQVGSFVVKGQSLATITSGSWIVESYLDAETLADLTCDVGDCVEICCIGNSHFQLRGTINKIASAGSTTIPAKSLTQIGGGDIELSNVDGEARQPYFKITIALDHRHSHKIKHGMTTIVKFQSQRVTVGHYIYRRGLQLVNKLLVSNS